MLALFAWRWILRVLEVALVNQYHISHIAEFRVYTPRNLSNPLALKLRRRWHHYAYFLGSTLPTSSIHIERPTGDSNDENGTYFTTYYSTPATYYPMPANVQYQSQRGSVPLNALVKGTRLSFQLKARYQRIEAIAPVMNDLAPRPHSAMSAHISFAFTILQE